MLVLGLDKGFRQIPLERQGRCDEVKQNLQSVIGLIGVVPEDEQVRGYRKNQGNFSTPRDVQQVSTTPSVRCSLPTDLSRVELTLS